MVDSISQIYQQQLYLNNTLKQDAYLSPASMIGAASISFVLTSLVETLGRVIVEICGGILMMLPNMHGADIVSIPSRFLGIACMTKHKSEYLSRLDFFSVKLATWPSG